MKQIFFYLIVSFLLITGCHIENSSKSRLKQRANEYYTYFTKGEYGSSWDLLWHDGKRKRNRDEWTIFAQEYDSEKKLIEFHIKSVSIYKVQNHILGKVNLLGKNRNLRINQVEKFEGDEDWIFENGDWFRYIE